jgi:hypothetical protein
VSEETVAIGIALRSVLPGRSHAEIEHQTRRRKKAPSALCPLSAPALIGTRLVEWSNMQLS